VDLAAGPTRRQSAGRLSYLVAAGPGQSVVTFLKPFPNLLKPFPAQKSATGHLPGLETAAPDRPRDALAVEGRERGHFELLEVLRCTGRLNATQPEV
jgi:hypothetical protein